MVIDTSLPSRPVSPDALADVQAISEALAVGVPADPEVVRRVQKRSAEARVKLLAARGVQEIGVALIRALRGELPNP